MTGGTGAGGRSKTGKEGVGGRQGGEQGISESLLEKAKR